MKNAQWDDLMGYVNMGSTMAAQHDASFVLVAVAEVTGDESPRGTWVTAGIGEESEDRSEATIAMLEHALRELRVNHSARFGKEPRQRGYQNKNG